MGSSWSHLEESRPATSHRGKGGIQEVDNEDKSLRGQAEGLASTLGASRSLEASPGCEVLAAGALGLPCCPEAQLQARVGSSQEHPSSSCASLSCNFCGCKWAKQDSRREKNVNTLSFCKLGMLSSGKIHNHTHTQKKTRDNPRRQSQGRTTADTQASRAL